MIFNRRTILTVGGIAATYYGLRQFGPALLPARSFAFEAVTDPAGFRRIPRGDGLSAGALLLGLDPTASPLPRLDAAAICGLLSGGSPWRAGQVNIAVFSDFFCPYCRVLDLEVRALAASLPDVEVIPHEVPLLGVPSQFAARAVIAAEAQGAYEAFHARLIRTDFVPNPAYLRGLAEAEGLDVAQFQSDMRSAATDRRLLQSAALFRVFGFAGTPALIVGRTLVNGAISPRDLRALVAIERSEGPVPGCSGNPADA